MMLTFRRIIYQMKMIEVDALIAKLSKMPHGAYSMRTEDVYAAIRATPYYEVDPKDAVKEEHK